MRKTLIKESPADATAEPGQWLDLEGLASVEVTSESPGYPIESVFGAQTDAGWRAVEAGKQVIRLIFDEPRDVRRIQLRFCEADVERTQEFVLEWAPPGGPLREIVRQQWNFSPDGANSEIEDYNVNLSGASVLQLTINPDIAHDRASASLSHWRLA
ncbi:MAG: hypothetical protein WBW33_00310 [Bryobacteraceae bacterium]